MTVVIRRYAVGFIGAAGALAAVASIVLISALLTTPQRVAAAIGDGDAQALVDLFVSQFVSAVRVIARYL